MKARIFKIFANNDYRIDYTYVDTDKWRDDIDSYSNNSSIVPMMTIRIYDDDGKLGEETNLFASPEIVKTYTHIDFFKILRDNGYPSSYEFMVETMHFGYTWEIEFEIKKGRYPYLESLIGTPEYRDRLIAPVVEYPKIIRLYKDEFHW